MKAKVSVQGGQTLNHRLAQLQDRLTRNSNVRVGIPKATGTYEDGTPLAVIAAVHEFGANIQHPGGTPYKFVEGGKAKFVKKGTADADGVTGPHTIPIPERSFLRVPLRSNQEVFQQAFRELTPKVVSGQMSMFQLMSAVGSKGVGVSQEAISSGIGPPLDPSTVKEKGSSQPLVDDGRLKQAITFVIGEGEE